MLISEQIFWLVIHSMIVASISWTFTQEEIFREWRDFCHGRFNDCEDLPR